MFAVLTFRNLIFRTNKSEPHRKRTTDSQLFYIKYDFHFFLVVVALLSIAKIVVKIAAAHKFEKSALLAAFVVVKSCFSVPCGVCGLTLLLHLFCSLQKI